jgi:hypothetical protein
MRKVMAFVGGLMVTLLALPGAARAAETVAQVAKACCCGGCC